MLKKISLILILCVSYCFAYSQDSTTVSTQTPQSYKVTFEGDSLFTINHYLGAYSPEERAAAISAHLLRIFETSDVQQSSFQVKTNGEYATIFYEEAPILCITEKDALQSGLSYTELAKQYNETIKSTFSKAAKQKNVMYWVIRAGYTLLTLLGLVFLFFLINRLFKLINKKLVAYETGLKRKRISAFKYLAPKGPDYFFVFVSKIIKTLLIIIILFFYLPFMFSFLPWTEGIVNKFYVFVSEPLKLVLNGLWSFISQKLIFLVIIYFISRYILRILSYVSQEIYDGKLKVKGFHHDWVKPTMRIVKVVIIVFTLVFMFPYIPGSNSKAFQGVSIFLGVLLSLGSTSAIANIIAGIVITYMRPFRIGDRVKINETIGDIVEKNLLVTKIKTTKNEDVTIPNATIINTHLWNFTKNAELMGVILHPTVTIGYDVPSQTVINLLLSAAELTEDLDAENSPFVLQKSLNDFYVEYELNVYTKQPNKMAHLYSELNRHILDVFNEAEVEILSPHYNAYRDGNASTIPQSEPTDITKNPVNKIIDKLTKQD